MADTLYNTIQNIPNTIQNAPKEAVINGSVIPLSELGQHAKYKNVADAYIYGEGQEYIKESRSLAENTPEIDKPSPITNFFKGLVVSGAESLSTAVLLPVQGGAGLGAGIVDVTGIDFAKNASIDAFEVIGEVRGNIPRQAVKLTDVSQEDTESFSYMLGSGLSSFGTAGLGSGLAVKGVKAINKNISKTGLSKAATKGASGTTFVLEYGSSLDKNMSDGDKQTKDKIIADTILALGQATTASFMEKYLGWGLIFNIKDKTVQKHLKNIFKQAAGGAASEGGTSLGQTALEYLGDRLDTKQLPEAFKEAVMAATIGAILEGGVGGYNAFRHKQTAYKILEDKYGSFIDNPAEKKLVFDTIYKAQEQVTSTLLLDTFKTSKQLSEKHGDVYNNLRKGIKQLIQNSGAFKDKSESQKAIYIENEARRFADTLLLEAANRNVPVDEIVKSTDIVYYDGQLYLKGKYFNTPSSKVQISTKGADNDRVVMDDQQPQQEGEQPVILNQEVLVDQAVKDGKNLPDIEARNINYNIDTKANRDVVIDVFNAIIPENERASYIDKEGYITPEGIIRVERAMLGSIIDDAVLLKQIVESQDESIKALTKALTDISSVINSLENRTRKGKLSDGYTIKDDIKKAVKKLVKAKLEGKSLSDMDMVDLTPSQKELLASFENAKSIKQIKNTIARYANVVDNVAKKRLFKSKKTPVSKDSILRTSRLHQEQVELSDTMKELDRTNKEYTAETINIDGKERSVYNSKGNRIAKSEKALRAFYEWFGDSKVVDKQGRPLVVYHGSTKVFDTFDISKSSKESDLGAAFYFTNNEDDVSRNYEGGGPDFENRVSRIAERIQAEEDISYEEAEEKARKQEFEESTKYPVYLKMENPFVIGGENETILTFEEKYNEETDEYDEAEGTLIEFAYQLDNALADVGIDYQISQRLFEKAAENGGEISASEIDDILRNDEELYSLYDYESSQGQLLSDVVGIEYDGFIDNTVNKKFGYERKTGKPMEGMDETTSHYIVFNPNQIKSVDNRGTFDINNPNIYYQMVGEKANLSDKQKNSLDSAKDMEQQGASNREIFARTGWFKGADGKWRIEISDKDAKINKAVFERLKRGQILVRLNEFFNHEKLFNLYPELKNIAVFVDHNGVLLKNAEAGFTYETTSIKDIASPSIIISKRASIQKLRKTILHEIQHYIQKVENFATGGNLKSFDKAIEKAQEQVKKHQDDLEAQLIKEKFGVDVPYHLMIKIHDDIFKGDTENKSYIYEELNLDRKAVKEYLLSKKDWLIEEAKKEVERVSKEIPASSAMEYYVKLYGEIEARNTEARMNMSEKARKQSFPEDTQDISNANAIVIFEDGTQMSYKVKEPKQERVVKNYTDRNNPSRITQRTIETLLPEEQNALDSFLLRTNDKERILENLNKNKFDDKGRITGYYTTTIESIFTQEAVERYFEGKEIDFESTIDAKTSTGKVSKLKSILESKQFSSAKTLEDKIKIIKNGYLKGILAHPTKVVNAVNSSLINCDPSLDCAKYCYATKGNYVFISNMPKADVIDLIVKKSPKTIAKWIADEWKQTTEFLAGKALRLFDKGDGSDSWVEVVKELNKQDVRVAIFTKKPDFMRKIKALKDNAGNEINLTMLSIDSTNENLANENKDLDVSYVYQGEQNLEFVKQLQADGRLNVVLPVKLGSDFMSEEDVKTLRDAGIETKRICPIDAGWGKLHKAGDKAPSNMIENGELKPVKVGEWNCALCDRNGGVGCFYKKTTKQMKELLEAYNQDVFTNKEEYAILKKGIDELDRLAEQGNITEESLNEIEERYFGKDKSDVRRDNSVLQRDVVHPNSRAFIRFGRIYSMFNERLKFSSSGVDNQRSRSEVLQGQGNASLRNNGEPQTLLREREEQRNRTQHDLFGIPETPQGDSGYGLLDNNDNLLYQRAFAASRVDYEKPSLEAIGTGEGNQAHGWGLYYALSRAVAERYREGFLSFIHKDRFVKYKGKTLADYFTEQDYVTYKAVKILSSGTSKEDAIKSMESFIEETKDNNVPLLYETKSENVEILKKLKEINVSDIEKLPVQKPQVHEVDIPEMPYLLDEQKTLGEQSLFVKKALKEVAKEIGVKWDSRYNNGKYIYDNISNILGSDKAASQLLEKHGIKGITYEGTRDGRCFVIFNDADVEVIDRFYQEKIDTESVLDVDYNDTDSNEAWQSLEDKQRKTTLKGFYDLAAKSIGITKDADFSTLPHEFAHFWFDNMWSYVESGEASAEYIERFEAVKKFIGLKDGERPTEKHHEKFARAYEKMLLTGTAPNVKIMKVFEEYKEFIEDVYNNVVEVDEQYGEKYEPLTEDMYNFFNSMVGHSLPRPANIEENKVSAAAAEEKLDNDVEAVIEEVQNVIKERAGKYTRMPVQTDNKVGYLTTYNKYTGENAVAGSAVLDIERKRAEEFVRNNPQLAHEIVMGDAPMPEGYIPNYIYSAYIDMQKELGNINLRADATYNKALELRASGQNISSEQLETDVVKPTNIISTVLTERTKKVAKKKKMTNKELGDYVKKEVRRMNFEGKSPEEIVNKLADDLAVKPKKATLVKTNNDTYAFRNLLKYVEERLGMGMSREEAINIIRMADDMNNNLKKSRSVTTENPSIEYFEKLRELEDYVNKLAPSSVWRVLVSVIGRGNLLASIKSPVTNIVSTAPTNIFMAATRRLILGVKSSIVDPELVSNARKEATAIYKKTGFHIFSMDDVTKGSRGILGEHITHSQGEGLIRAAGRVYEKVVYETLMGRPDVWFKNLTFTDYASLKATKLANGDKAKANELFKDACRIEPKTDEGKQIRKEAVQEALIATYQNKGYLSETMLKMRDALNFKVGFGEFLVPFVKTPANIVETSLNMAFGIPRAIISQTVRDIQRGKIFSTWTQENVRLCVENGLGVLLAMAIAAGLDDDDYMPAYALATEKDKQLARELNIPYNSVRLGDTWYSLDYLGVLAAPLVSVLQAKKSEDIMGKMWGYAKGGLLQTTTLPVAGSIADVMSNIQTTLKKEGEEVVEDVLEGSVQTLYNRVVLMLVTDIAKALDPYEREKSGFGIQQNIPLARQLLDKKYNMTSGESEKLGNAFIDMFAGARIKEQVRNDVADELKRLNDAGFGVTLKDVTKGTKFSDLDEETKQEVRVRYAEEYSERVSDLINSDEYQELEDAEKSQAIGKIRTKIMKELREEFL